MELFIHRLPLYEYVKRDKITNKDVIRYGIYLPVDVRPVEYSRYLGNLRPYAMKVDTACGQDVFCWGNHLARWGLVSDDSIAGEVNLRTATSTESTPFPIRTAALWLFSNLTQFRDEPRRVALSPGVTFKDSDCEDAARPPLIGLSPLLRAGMKIEIDSVSRTVSVWVPQRRPRTLRDRLLGWTAGKPKTYDLPWQEDWLPDGFAQRG